VPSNLNSPKGCLQLLKVEKHCSMFYSLKYPAVENFIDNKILLKITFNGFEVVNFNTLFNIALFYSSRIGKDIENRILIHMKIKI